MTSSRIRVANAPVSWGALEIEGFNQKPLPYDVVLDEIADDAPQRTFELFRKHNGDLQCIFRIYDNSRQFAGRWVSRRFTITASDEVMQGLQDIYGKRNVRLVGA